MKKIVIIGGGISGLAVLHYLKQRFAHSIDITLVERETSLGGTIRSFKKGSCLFEWGPNGFLDNQPVSLELIEELGITDQLITANHAASRRYIQLKGKLIPLPRGPIDFIRTPLLPTRDKLALIKGLFKKNISNDCSMYDYVSQRFSPTIAESVVDPFISGIYAGDIKRLHMAAAFPKMKRNGNKKTHMRSLRGGMGQVIDALEKCYRAHIQTGKEINSVSDLLLNDTHLILSTPAYEAAKIIGNANSDLAQALTQAPYAPIAVVGLLFKKDSFKVNPDGFGYLIASQEGKEALGVLIESNVYTARAPQDHVMMRVMLGGAHHPDINKNSPEQIIAKAIKEIDFAYGLIAQPIDTFVKQWSKAIPQYETNYPQWRQSLSKFCNNTPNIHLCANYLDGISFNDCVNNAKNLALNFSPLHLREV